MKSISFFFFSIFVFSFSLNCSGIVENTPGVSLELAEYRKSKLSDIRYELALDIPSEKEESISGNISIDFNLKENLIDLPLDFKEENDHILSLTVNGTETNIIFEKEHILLPVSLLKSGSNKIEIGFIAGDNSLNRKDEFLYTLFVPDRARTAFPLFDQPNLKARYLLTLKTPLGWEAISNAPVKSMVSSENETTWEFEESDLISSYLFSFVAGEFERVTKTINDREMTMLHRETDQEKVERNLNDIFQLHASSLTWLEEYTGIKYPFKKFDFALIPSFQYGGMEHVGAIQYRASSLFLDESPSDTRLLSRASLIAHETAHMWFGDLVTMNWFNDVWTKEVFANFMASKIVNPDFPDIDHELNFLVRHYPSAYSVDRTEGANPIRQQLPNLNEAGTMYGAIIYNKAPIMMRQLEMLVGEKSFQKGLREYLTTFSFDNATWPDLISILDQKTNTDLNLWSNVWVNTAGRPNFEYKPIKAVYGKTEMKYNTLVQKDPKGEDRLWLQKLNVFALQADSIIYRYDVDVTDRENFVRLNKVEALSTLLNSTGIGYGFFPLDNNSFKHWQYMKDIERGSLLINAYENVLEGVADPIFYLEMLLKIVPEEENQLILNLSLGHINSIYWNLLSEEFRTKLSSEIEELLWNQMIEQNESSTKKIFFNNYRNLALSNEALSKLYSIWNKENTIEGLTLSENDFIELASSLAIKLPEQSEYITSQQLDRIQNTDRKQRFEFLIPSLSNDQNGRDKFFDSLKNEEQRETESWVLSALGNLHHPLRMGNSEKYILPSLELLQEIQQTGDIFFPAGWTSRTLRNYSSTSAVKTVRDFLKSNPDYNYQLRLKILQAADPMFRANEIKAKY